MATGPTNDESFAKNTNTSVDSIVQAYKDLIKDPKNLDEAANYMYQSLLDDAIFGVFLEVHHLHKTGNLTALDGETEDGDGDASLRIVDEPNCDIFGNSTANICPNCDSPVLPARFAPHLKECMGMDRTSSPSASSHQATKKSTSASSSSPSSSDGQTNAGSGDNKDNVD